MADTPLPVFPNEEDRSILSDYINLQQQLEHIYNQQHKVIDEIRDIDVDLEKKLTQRLALQRKHIQLQKDDQQLLSEQLQQAATLEGQLADEMKVSIEGTRQRLQYHKEIVAQLGSMNDYEMALAKRRSLEDKKWANFTTKVFKDIFGFQNKELENAAAITKELEKYPYNLGMAAGAISAIIVLLKKAYDLFQNFDKAAWDFRKAMGFVRSDAQEIRKSAERLAIDFMHVGVTIDGAYEAFRDLGQEMGSVFAVSNDLVKTTAIMKAQLGVAETSTAGFLRNMAAVSKSSMQTQQSMVYVAADLSEAAGVNLPDVMKDIAKMSSVTLSMVSRLPNQILKSAIEARRLNTTIAEMAKGSREVLNFTDNINAEMEASVLLGHSINLQRARELAYRRDIEGSTKEILRITKSINFDALDVFQQEAFARATGRTVDELLRMVQAEKQWDAARRDPNLSSKVKAYEQMRAANEANAKANAQNLESVLQTRANQERLTAISQKWNQILSEAAQLFLPIIDGFLAAVIPAMDISRGLFGWVTALKGLSFLGKLGGIFGKIAGFAAKGLSMLGWVTKIASVFGKWVPVVGWIITAVQLVVNLFQRLHGIGEAFQKGIIHGLLFGLKAVGLTLYDTLLKPFVSAWNWIKGIFIGKSPSMLGRGIVQGILGVASAVFDALTYPWRHFLAWVLDKVPFMGKYAKALRGGAGGFTESKFETSPTQMTNGGEPVQVSQAEEAKTNTSDKYLQDILVAIQNLNNNLESGKIGINIDGQLLSATLARQTEFRGGYGVNKV